MCYINRISIVFISLILLPPFFAHAEQSSDTLLMPPVTVSPTFNNNPPIHVEVQPIIHYSPNSNNSIIRSKMHEFTIATIQSIQETCTKENYSRLAGHASSLLWNKRYPIMGGAFLLLYSSIALLLIADYTYCTADTRWAAWKSECSYADLWALPKKDIEYELLHAIAQRNCNAKKPTDIIHPLVTFITEITTEIHRLNRYITIASIIKKTRFTKIFPVTDQKIEKVKQLLERVHCIKQIFLSWLADYNVRSTYIL